MSQPDAERCFFFANERSAVLDIVSGNPQFIKGVQEIGNLRVINGYMPYCGDETGVAPLDVACGVEKRPDTMKRTVIGGKMNHLVLFDHHILLRRAKEPRRGCKRTGNTLLRRGG